METILNNLKYLFELLKLKKNQEELDTFRKPSGYKNVNTSMMR